MRVVISPGDITNKAHRRRWPASLLGAWDCVEAWPVTWPVTAWARHEVPLYGTLFCGLGSPRSLHFSPQRSGSRPGDAVSHVKQRTASVLRFQLADGIKGKSMTWASGGAGRTCCTPCRGRCTAPPYGCAAATAPRRTRASPRWRTLASRQRRSSTAETMTHACERLRRGRAYIAS